MDFERVEIGPCTLYRGDAFKVMAAADFVADAVITDPPYASGGMYRADRVKNPSEKYVHSGIISRKASFEHDAKDQRVFMSWCSEWLQRVPVKDGGYVLSFIDWRQLPALTDAMQWAGLVWRGVCPWDKGLGIRAPHKGYARHQAEYIVWATKGHCPIAKHGGPWPGVYRHPVLQRDKHHMVGKPTPLLEELVQWVEPGGIVFDPFMGSGTAGVAAINQGRRFVGCEIDDHYFEVARARIQAAYDAAQREAA